jgi:hypothetical protein
MNIIYNFLLNPNALIEKVPVTEGHQSSRADNKINGQKQKIIENK